jgi:hypothetical protein
MRLFKAPAMTPKHRRWQEFCNKLGVLALDCAGTRERPFARAILASMGSFDIEGSLAYFDNHQAYCDCEILLNVEALA